MACLRALMSLHCCEPIKRTLPPVTYNFNPLFPGARRGYHRFYFANQNFKFPMTTMSPRGATEIFGSSELSVPKLCQPPKFADEKFLYILATTYFALGVMLFSSGYRYYKTSMYAIGFTFAGLIVYLMCIQEKHIHNANHDLYATLVACLAGLLFGLISMLIHHVGVLVSGLKNGLILGTVCLALYNNTFDKHVPATYMQTALILVMTVIICVVLNVYFKKGMFIICTSVSGSTYIFLSLDFLLNNWATVIWVVERIKRVPFIFPPCLTSWLLLCFLPCIALLGILTQWTLTGTGIRHEETQKARRSKTAPLHLTREQRAEMRQRKYRYLYQVRTAHGDVISQSYVQALQQKTSNSETWNAGGECSTLQSDSTHLTVLASEAPHPDSDEEIANQIRACH